MNTLTTETETQETQAPATLDPAAQLALSQTKIDALRQAITDAALNNEDVTANAIALAGAMGAHTALMKTANEGALQAETATLGAAILAAVHSSKLAELSGEAVSSIYWTITPGEGDNGPVMTCSINVKARAVSAPRKPGSGGNTGGRVKLGTYSVDGGEAMSAKDFITAHATEETRGNSLFSTGKWVTKPSFLAEAVKGLEAAGRTVVHTPAE